MKVQVSLSRREVMALLCSAMPTVVLSQAIQAQATNHAKMALCIGNSRYVTRPLKNPVNDAKSIGGALKDLGFDVTILSNSSLKEMREAFRLFFERIKAAEAAFIFYAGHGFEVQGVNYLIPSDADPSTITSSDIARVAYSMRNLTAELERSGARVRVVVIDACRDTPKRGLTSGMQQMTAKGSLLAFSTSPGNLAEDSIVGIRTNNSPYAFALTESLRNRDLTLKEMFNRAHATVAALTQDRQIPWVHDGMTGDIRLYDSKVIVNAAVVDSSKLSTASSSGRRGLSSQEVTAQNNDPNEPTRATDEMTPKEAREKLKLLGYRGTDGNIANSVIRSVDVESADLCLIAGIQLKYTSISGGFIVPARLVDQESRRVSRLLPKIKQSGVDIDERAVARFYGSQIPSISARPIQLFREIEKFGVQNPDEIRFEIGLATYDFELSLLSYAIWIRKYDVVKTLLNLGASLSSEITAIGYGKDFSEKRIKISTSGSELKIDGFKI